MSVDPKLRVKQLIIGVQQDCGRYAELQQQLLRQHSLLAAHDVNGLAEHNQQQTQQPQTQRDRAQRGQRQPGQRLGRLDDRTSGDMVRASELIGANIKNDQGEDVGEIEDLVIDSQNGRVGYAAVSYGGFLGMGERYIAIPLSALRWNGERERWMLSGATVDSLKARPAFTYPERR